MGVNENKEDMENKKADLLHEFSIELDASTLSLTFKAIVEYVGYSSDGNYNDDFNLGTTYWIGFESIGSVAGGLSAPGTCSNRKSSDYKDADGNTLEYPMWWGYPVNPMTLDTVQTAERMAYPPSDWSLSSTECNKVVYSRKLSWTDLTSCEDAQGNSLISVTETDERYLMEGTFFVELVSPYSMASPGYLRTFQLVQKKFAMAISRSVDVLASTGVQLFISSVMAYGRDDDGNYELTILTQSADYVMLGMDDTNAIDTPAGLSVSLIEGVNSECLSASSFTCGQIFTATIPAVCPEGESPIVDLSGKYQFSFTPTCRNVPGESNEACDVFMTTLPDSGKVVLDVTSAFQDACASLIFEMQLTGALTFYSDAAFSAAVTAPFVIGQDTIYGKVTVDIPDDVSGERYQFLDVSIEKIYVCTAAEGVDLTANLDAADGQGGCLSSGIVDADGPYTVYGNGAVAEYQGSTDYGTVVTANNEAAFSFLTFDTPRETIAVHVHLLVTMVDDADRRRQIRRRMLLQESGTTGNAFRSYIGTVKVANAQAETEDVSDPVGTNDAAAFAVGLLPAMLMLIGWVMG